MSTKSFDNLQFDVTKFGGKVNIQDAYPELLPYKEYHDIKPEEWKIAILMTDIGSDYVKIKDPKQKTEAIFKAVGLDIKKNIDIFESTVSHKSGGVMKACSFLIEYQNNHEFSAWFSMNKIYYDLIRLINEPIDISDIDYDRKFDLKVARQSKLDKMQSDLKKYEMNLFGTAAMKAAAFREKKKVQAETNYNEKYAQSNQVE